ncbi:thioredoxin family protein [Shimia thalassica]|uniref:thioredoxin family protein n=1 Tax=Shimia thalassica TaxID=1715693 RepID=UPI001C0A63EB|nr:thioredoxin family protein [Shimia thalassica]MBU2944884.1 thioredoxin family protein [Shimia thalassica]MDO6485000.1 thioredoxin family protein [Shimia thalassica]MDO6504810.1 thioredoxin family protein [Shimia thalassica]
MKRRDFILSGTATLAAAALPNLAIAAVDYAPGLVQKHLDAGDTVFLDFKADWCGTCKAQERVINALKSENGDYEKNITFVNVDWDAHSKADLTKRLKIPRRSTLVVLKGNKELGRIVAGTSKDQIKDLMDTALTASVA